MVRRLIFGAVGIAIGLVTARHFRQRLQAQHAAWRIRAALLAPIALRAGLSAEDISRDLLDADDWVLVMRGGDLSEGEISGLGLCPSHHCYSVATNQIALAAVPNPAQIPAMLAYPADPPPEDRCADNCLHVKTHRWRGWMVVRNTATGALLLNCSSFAQYHCIKPDDPDRGKPPGEGPPKPQA